MSEDNLAVVIAACDRVDYFKQCATALSNSDWVKHHTVYASFDVIDNKSLRLQKESLLAVANGAFICRTGSRIGCGRHLIDIRRKLFDNMGYDYVLVIEDDVVVPPNYVEFMCNLMNWAERYDDIGVVSAYNRRCKQSVAPGHYSLNRVSSNNSNWISYMMSRQCWEDIRNIVYEYEQKFLQGWYNQRDNDAIRNYFRPLINNSTRRRGRTLYESPWQDIRQFGRAEAIMPTGQDACTAVAMYHKGWCKLTTAINRLKYIGVNGEHTNSQLFKQYGFDSVAYAEYPGDKDRTQFVTK